MTGFEPGSSDVNCVTPLPQSSQAYSLIYSMQCHYGAHCTILIKIELGNLCKSLTGKKTFFMIEKPLENKETFLVTKAQPNPESIIFIIVSISTQRTKGHLPTFFIKNGLFPASFSLFLSFQYS